VSRTVWVLVAVALGYFAWREWLSVKVKDGVNLSGMTAPALFGLTVSEVIFGRHGAEMVVTSGTDGVHSAGSRHYSGNAFDLRTRNLTGETLTAILDSLKSALSKFGFDVVRESDHIHVEYDPKGGRAWSLNV
jgi:hypothetical protein